MKVIPTAIPDVLLINPDVLGDERGYFFESFNRRRFGELIGREFEFVQDNHACSRRQVLRGLHYQNQACAGQAHAVVSRSGGIPMTRGTHCGDLIGVSKKRGANLSLQIIAIA